jgi:hypothetical protein
VSNINRILIHGVPLISRCKEQKPQGNLVLLVLENKSSSESRGNSKKACIAFDYFCIGKLNDAGAPQNIQQYALDPNLIDDDIFNAQETMHSLAAQAAYNFTASVCFSGISERGVASCNT